jgi:hypothetical protein
LKITKKEIREIVQEALFEESFLNENSSGYVDSNGQAGLPQRQRFYQQARSVGVNTSYSDGHHGQRNSSTWGRPRVPAQDVECFVAGSEKIISTDGGKSFFINTDFSGPVQGSDYVSGMGRENCPIVFQLPGEVSFEYTIMSGAWYSRSKRDHGPWRRVTSTDKRCMLDQIFLDTNAVVGTGACGSESAAQTRAAYVRSDQDQADDNALRLACDGLPAVRPASFFEGWANKICMYATVAVPLPNGGLDLHTGTGPYILHYSERMVNPTKGHSYWTISWGQVKQLAALVYVAANGSSYGSLPDSLKNSETQQFGGFCPATSEEWESIFGSGPEKAFTIASQTADWGVNSEVFRVTDTFGGGILDILKSYKDLGTQFWIESSEYGPWKSGERKYSSIAGQYRILAPWSRGSTWGEAFGIESSVADVDFGWSPSRAAYTQAVMNAIAGGPEAARSLNRPAGFTGDPDSSAFDGGIWDNEDYLIVGDRASGAVGRNSIIAAISEM